MKLRRPQARVADLLLETNTPLLMGSLTLGHLSL